MLIAAIELASGTSTWLWIAAISFLLARVAHALGMDGLRGAREGGTLVTFLLLLGLGLYAIALPWIAGNDQPPAIIETVPAVG
jgi:uncharacterized membrane protein YecN with MAPEG domain